MLSLQRFSRMVTVAMRAEALSLALLLGESAELQWCTCRN